MTRKNTATATATNNTNTNTNTNKTNTAKKGTKAMKNTNKTNNTTNTTATVNTINAPATVTINPADLPTVKNNVFADCDGFRLALFNRRNTIEAVKLTEDRARIEKAMTADGLTPVELEALRVKYTMLTASINTRIENATATRAAYAEFISIVIEAGNKPQTVEFILNLLSTAEVPALRAYALRGALGTTAGSTAEVFYNIFDKFLHPADGYTADGRANVPAAVYKTTATALETLFKEAFSLPFSSPVNEKTRVKLSGKNINHVIMSYAKCITCGVSNDKKTNTISIDTDTDVKPAITKTIKKGIVSYNANEFMKNITNILLSKLGTSEEENK